MTGHLGAILRDGADRLQPSVIDSYLLKRLFAPFLAIEAAVVFFLLFERALRLILELSVKGADIAYFWPLIIRVIPFFINMALPISFVIAVVILVARLDDGRELEAMLAGGVSLPRIAAPLMVAGVIVMIISLLTAAWFEPLARYGFRTLRVEAIETGQKARIIPQAFYRPGRDVVVFQQTETDNSPRSVFVWQPGGTGGEQIVTARSAYFAFDGAAGMIWMRLTDGLAFGSMGWLPGDDRRVFEFEQLHWVAHIDPSDANWARGRDARELTMVELFRPGFERRNRLGPAAISAELYFRITRALIIPFFPLLVLPLVIVGGRGGRLPGAFLAGGLCLAAVLALNIVRQKAATGAVEALPLMAVVVVGFAVAATALFASGRHLPSHGPMKDLLGVIADSASQRLGSLSVSFAVPGRVLSSYVSGHVLIWIGVSLAALVAALDMAEILLAGDAFERRDMGLVHIAHYAALRAPAFALQSLPGAVLIGSIAAFTVLTSRKELLNCSLLGLSQMQLVVMLWPVMLMLAGSGYVLAEHVVPHSQARFDQWWRATDTVQTERSAATWFRMDGMLISAVATTGDGTGLGPVSVFHLDRDGQLVARVKADRAAYGPEGWSLSGVHTERLASGQNNADGLERLDWLDRIRPDDVRQMFHTGTQFSASWAVRALNNEVPAHLPDAAYQTRVHRQATAPLLALVMLLLAIPLAGSSRSVRYRVFALLWALATGAVVMVSDGLLMVMAMTGFVPVLVGTWATPVLALWIATSAVIMMDR